MSGLARAAHGVLAALRDLGQDDLLTLADAYAAPAEQIANPPWGNGPASSPTVDVGAILARGGLGTSKA